MERYNQEKNRMQQRRREKHEYLDRIERQQLEEKQAEFHRECANNERNYQHNIDIQKQHIYQEKDRKVSELRRDIENQCQRLQNELRSFEEKKRNIEYRSNEETRRINSENEQKKRQIGIEMDLKKQQLQHDKELTKKVVRDYLGKDHDQDVIDVLDLEYAGKLDMITYHAMEIYPKMAADIQG